MRLKYSPLLLSLTLLGFLGLGAVLYPPVGGGGGGGSATNAIATVGLATSPIVTSATDLEFWNTGSVGFNATNRATGHADVVGFTLGTLTNNINSTNLTAQASILDFGWQYVAGVETNVGKLWASSINVSNAGSASAVWMLGLDNANNVVSNAVPSGGGGSATNAITTVGSNTVGIVTSATDLEVWDGFDIQFFITNRATGHADLTPTLRQNITNLASIQLTNGPTISGSASNYVFFANTNGATLVTSNTTSGAAFKTETNVPSVFSILQFTSAAGDTAAVATPQLAGLFLTGLSSTPVMQLNTNVMASSTNTLDFNKSDYTFVSLTAVSVTGFANLPTTNSANIVLTLVNTSGTNWNLTLPTSILTTTGVRGTVTVTNGQDRIVWLRYNPGSGHTNECDQPNF